MVQLVEVEDEHFQHAQEGPVEDDGDFTDTDSEISNDSDYDPAQESLAERISALRDIIPPTTRSWFWEKYQATHRVVKGVIFFAGRSMWSISVSALLIGVPFALCWAEEQQVIAMEQEARMREMGADVLTAGGGEGGSTADLVGQHLGKEGGVEVKAPGL
ncbi:mitochondrial import receptor subunit tom22 [Diaporthe sp. PMI_573]|nr:mitochondrial import receptor subunit tom22 [Diaporthaceae sp. PMI_573]